MQAYLTTTSVTKTSPAARIVGDGQLDEVATGRGVSVGGCASAPLGSIAEAGPRATITLGRRPYGDLGRIVDGVQEPKVHTWAPVVADELTGDVRKHAR